MAEEKALRQGLGDGPAVHRHQRAVGILAQPMDGAGEDLLARSRLPFEKDRKAGGGKEADLFVDLLDGRARPLVKLLALPPLLGQVEGIVAPADHGVHERVGRVEEAGAPDLPEQGVLVLLLVRKGHKKVPQAAEDLAVGPEKMGPEPLVPRANDLGIRPDHAEGAMIDLEIDPGIDGNALGGTDESPGEGEVPKDPLGGGLTQGGSEDPNFRLGWKPVKLSHRRLE